MYLVTGGHGSERLSSTEVMPASGTSWSYVADLPGARYGLRGTTLNNQIFMTGSSITI